MDLIQFEFRLYENDINEVGYTSHINTITTFEEKYIYPLLKLTNPFHSHIHFTHIYLGLGSFNYADHCQDINSHSHRRGGHIGGFHEP